MKMKQIAEEKLLRHGFLILFYMANLVVLARFNLEHSIEGLYMWQDILDLSLPFNLIFLNGLFNQAEISFP